MNAPIRASYFVRLLMAAYDHEGLKLDLHGYMDESGYNVTLATVPGTMISVGADADLLSGMSANLDEAQPTSQELIAASRAEARAERAAHSRAMAY
jgi:hypothetical protein